jgi:hypothetical protein
MITRTRSLAKTCTPAPSNVIGHDLKSGECIHTGGNEGKTPCEGLHCYSTSTYKLHYLNTLTGLRFVLITDPAVTTAQPKVCHTESHSMHERAVLRSIDLSDLDHL